MDFEIRGTILRKGENSVLFKAEDGIEVVLPREQIAIIEEVEGVTVAMSYKLARSKGFTNSSNNNNSLFNFENMEEEYGTF